MAASASKRKYGLVALGGTFDRIHKGHEKFLSRAFELGDKVIIGLSSDKLVQASKKKHEVDTYASRLGALQAWLVRQGLAERAKVAELNDPYGPAAIEPRLEAIVVTEDSLPTALELNKIRRENGLTGLIVEKVPLVKTEDGLIISSTKVRAGEMDTSGRCLRKKSRRE